MVSQSCLSKTDKMERSNDAWDDVSSSNREEAEVAEADSKKWADEDMNDRILPSAKVVPKMVKQSEKEKRNDRKAQREAKAGGKKNYMVNIVIEILKNPAIIQMPPVTERQLVCGKGDEPTRKEKNMFDLMKRTTLGVNFALNGVKLDGLLKKAAVHYNKPKREIGENKESKELIQGIEDLKKELGVGNRDKRIENEEILERMKTKLKTIMEAEELAMDSKDYRDTVFDIYDLLLKKSKYSYELFDAIVERMNIKTNAKPMARNRDDWDKSREKGDPFGPNNYGRKSGALVPPEPQDEQNKGKPKGPLYKPVLVDRQGKPPDANEPKTVYSKKSHQGNHIETTNRFRPLEDFDAFKPKPQLEKDDHDASDAHALRPKVIKPSAVGGAWATQLSREKLMAPEVKVAKVQAQNDGIVEDLCGVKGVVVEQVQLQLHPHQNQNQDQEYEPEPEEPTWDEENDGGW